MYWTPDLILKLDNIRSSSGVRWYYTAAVVTQQTRSLPGATRTGQIRTTMALWARHCDRRPRLRSCSYYTSCNPVEQDASSESGVA